MFIAPHGERPKTYVLVTGWREKYEPCQAPLVPVSPLFACASLVFIAESLGYHKAIYCVALTHLCVMVVRVLLQQVYPEGDVITLNIPGFDLRMRESV